MIDALGEIWKNLVEITFVDISGEKTAESGIWFVVDEQNLRQFQKRC